MGKIQVENFDNKYLEPIRSQINDFRSRLQQLIAEINKITSFKDLPVVKLNSIIGEIITVITIIEKSLQEVIHSKLFQIGRQVYNLLNKLYLLEQVIDPVNIALQEKITVPYSIKVIVKFPKRKKVKYWISFWNFIWK